MVEKQPTPEEILNQTLQMQADEFPAAHLLSGTMANDEKLRPLYRDAIRLLQRRAQVQNRVGGVGGKPEQTLWRAVEGILKDDNRSLQYYLEDPEI